MLLLVFLFFKSTLLASLGAIANANQSLFRKVLERTGTERALRISGKPFPIAVVISCVTVHDVSSHLRLRCVKYKLSKEQNQNWPYLYDFGHRGGSTHMSRAMCSKSAIND